MKKKKEEDFPWIIASQDEKIIKKHNSDLVCVCLRCKQEQPIKPGKMDYFMDQMKAFILIHKHCTETKGT